MSFVVCARYNIETSPNSFGYLASYASRDLKELQGSLDTIRRSASGLITEIDEKLQEIVSERGIDLTARAPELPPDPLSPDPSITLADMAAYGYFDEFMLPLNRDRALELFGKGYTVYMLYDDNTEAMAFDRDEIITFSEMNQGLFGIAKGDWESSPEYAALSAPAPEPLEIKESEPLDRKELDPMRVYPHPLAAARESGELDVYRENKRLNCECAQAIQTAIHDNNYEQYRYDMKSAYNSVVSEYGVERLNYVLANTLQYKDYDGRFSRENKEWGNGIVIHEQDRAAKADFVCDAHPVLVDGFISVARKEQASILNKLKNPPRRDAENITPQREKGMEI